MKIWLQSLVFFSALLLARLVFSQSAEPKWSGGFFVIQDKVAFKNGDAVFANPETMPDRIVLDSAKKMVAKKTSFPMGYTYYEWRRKDGFKTYEEIRIRNLNYKSCTYFTASGEVNPPSKNSFNNKGAIDYYKFMPNPKYRYNGFNIAQKIHVSFSAKATDSLKLLYQIPKAKLLPGTEWWTEFNFYENGHIKSKGLLVTGLKESTNQTLKEQELGDLVHAPQNQFKLGEWLYYDEQGKQFYQEILTELKKVR